MPHTFETKFTITVTYMGSRGRHVETKFTIPVTYGLKR